MTATSRAAAAITPPRFTPVRRAALFALTCIASGAFAQRTELVSRTPTGMPGANHSQSPAISVDGRYVAFASDAGDILPGVAGSHVYRLDRETGVIALVSAAAGGIPAAGVSAEPALSADGRYIAFSSNATNLVAVSVNSRRQVYVRDMASGSVEIVSISQTGAHSNSDCRSPVISADGRVVVFLSGANNLIPGYSGGADQVYLRDRQSWTTEIVSRGVGNAPSANDCVDPVISADGRFVAFSSYSYNLVPDDANGRQDVFVRDRVLSLTVCASRTPNNTEGDRDSFRPSLSADGGIVAFSSYALNFAPINPQGAYQAQVYAKDRASGALHWLTPSAPGACSDVLGGDYARVSGDGLRVAFIGDVGLSGCCQYGEALFLREIASGAILRADISRADAPIGMEFSSSNYSSPTPAVSFNAGVVAFVTRAAEGGNSTYTNQVFVRDLTRCQPGRWSQLTGGFFQTPANWCSGTAPNSASPAAFGVPAAYTVQFASSPIVSELRVTDGAVDLDLNGRTLSAIGSASATLLVGAPCPTTASLDVREGTIYSRHNTIVGGSYPPISGALAVAGTGAALACGGWLYVISGYSEDGPATSVDITNGARATAGFLAVSGTQSSLDVAGVGASLDVASTADFSSGAVRVLDGGVLTIHAEGAPESACTLSGGGALIDGAGATLRVAPDADGRLALWSASSLAIDHGGLVHARSLTADPDYTYYSGAAAVEVRAADSLLHCEDRITIGRYDFASLALVQGGRVRAPLVEIGVFGDLRGVGSLQGVLRVTGVLLPGDNQSIGIGALAVTGDIQFTPFGAAFFDLGPAGAHDRVEATGALMLDGGLIVEAPPNFDPPLGATFDILGAASILGDFAFISLPQLPFDKRLQLISSLHGLSLVVIRGCFGDANGDLVIDFADLNVVVHQLGQIGAGLGGDLDGDSDCDFADLNIVLARYGLSC